MSQSQVVYPQSSRNSKLTNGHSTNGKTKTQKQDSVQLPTPDSLKHPKQPQFLYDLTTPWEDMVKQNPNWLGTFPPKQKLYKFLGYDLISPIAIAAGPASGKLWTDFYFKMGFGMVMQKTRRTTFRPSNLTPNVAIVHTKKPLTREDLNKPLVASADPNDFEEFQSITNSFGNPCSDLSDWAEELSRQSKSVPAGQLLGCSVTATALGESSNCNVYLGSNPTNALIVETASDLLIGATAAVLNGAKLIELNLACPNVTENAEEGEMFQNPQLVAYTLAEFKRRFPNVPIGFKFGIYKSKDQMKKVFTLAGENLDFVSGINAIPMTVLAKDGSEILPGRKTSGVAGLADQIIALEHIEWAAQIREEEALKYEIIGGGGIIKIADVDRYRNAGADIVQVATVAMTNPLFAYKYMLQNLS